MIDIYKLELHEQMTINNGMTTITRVPGGWIYEMWRLGKIDFDGGIDYEPYSSVFVPLISEFLP